MILTGLAYNLAPAASSAASDTEWQLTVAGSVKNPLNLTLSDIVAMPNTTVTAVLVCVDYPNQPLAQGNWTGVKLRTSLEKADPSSEIVKVGFFASDGYSTDLPIETAMRDGIILGSEGTGASYQNLRLVLPGKWGYKWISQITSIELFDYNFLDHWKCIGYSDVANIDGSGE